GGLLAFWMIGLFVGPVVLSVTYALIEEWVAQGQPRPAERVTAAALAHPPGAGSASTGARCARDRARARLRRPGVRRARSTRRDRRTPARASRRRSRSDWGRASHAAPGADRSPPRSCGAGTTARGSAAPTHRLSRVA